MQPGPIVETTSGPVRGTLEDGLHIFRGIPFAAPPVGKRRWLPPQPVEPWREVRPADGFGPSSPQNPVVVPMPNDLVRVEGEQSEDCLYLNVWTPGIGDAHRRVEPCVIGAHADRRRSSLWRTGLEGNVRAQASVSTSSTDA